MKFLLLGLVVATLLNVAFGAKVRYDDFSIIRMKFDPTNEEQINFVKRLPNSNFTVDMFSSRDVMIRSDRVNELFDFLSTVNISGSILHQNYQSLIDNVGQQQDEARVRSGIHSVSNRLSADDFFSAYRSNDEIHAFFVSLNNEFPGFIQIKNIGQTYQKNDQWAYIVTANKTSSTGSADKPTIVLEGGIHAREWIAHSTVTYIANSLITGYGNTTFGSLLDDFIFVFIPVVNVDGYIYTWTTDRNWRKTRTPTSNILCVGADPNRNWDSHWCEEGASTSPCSESYCGSKPFSEPCVKNVADFILTLKNVKSFIDFHSYSQLWMRPYGYTASLPKDSAVQAQIGKQSVAAISKSSGLTYEEGSIYTIIYPASGSSADWGYDTAKIPYPYGVELRDTGEYGFVLPPDQIIPCGEEILAAVSAMAEYILQHPTSNIESRRSTQIFRVAPPVHSS